MPQVAAYADEHLVVAKRVSDGLTSTVVEPIAGPERVTELAAMLGGGGSEAAAANARELIGKSERWKQQRRQA
jgi:DNA repair protein RecN (Recombination protein N)